MLRIAMSSKRQICETALNDVSCSSPRMGIWSVNRVRGEARHDEEQDSRVTEAEGAFCGAR